MNKLFLIKNPEVFQGGKKLNKSESYFEGWYFKNTNKENGISFIPGINIENKNKKVFIQIITNDISHYVSYDIKDFEYCLHPFYVKIGNNFFSKDGIHINIKTPNLNVYGEVKYSKGENINTNILNPNIMGPFSYIPFMECNHAILNMKNCASGSIRVNSQDINFNNDIGYIEKDWGCSFPKSYIWCQGNNFKKSNASFMLSIANIPFKIFEFRGLICVLKIDDKEYKFATYNNSKILKYDVNKSINIILKKGDYEIDIKSSKDDGLKLSAPVKGKMEKDIYESISSKITVILKYKNNIIFGDTSSNCGLEVV